MLPSNNVDEKINLMGSPGTPFGFSTFVLRPKVNLNAFSNKNIAFSGLYSPGPSNETLNLFSGFIREKKEQRTVEYKALQYLVQNSFHVFRS